MRNKHKNGHRDDDGSNRTPQRLMKAGEVAELLRVTEDCLEKWRIKGRGPRFVKVEGKIVGYRPSDIAAYQENNLRTSTSGR